LDELKTASQSVHEGLIGREITNRPLTFLSVIVAESGSRSVLQKKGKMMIK